MKVIYSSHFRKAFKKLKVEQQNSFFEKLIFLQEDIFHSQLKTHKLKGSFKNHHAFSLNYSDRVIFQYQSNPKTIYLYDIGSHNIYR